MARGPLAGAAGPGKFSVRTDGMSLPSAGYGEGVETAAIKSGAPLAKTPDVKGMSRSEMGVAPSQMQPVTSLYAPTQRPDEPITAGIARGEGPGPEVLGINAAMPREKTSDILVRMLPFDATGEIAILLQEAQARGD
jgi:hypothetical protein